MTMTRRVMRLTSLVLASPFLLSSLLIVVVKGQECATDGACDSHIRCPIWAEEGECFRSRAYMKKHCPVSCRSGLAAMSQEKHCLDAHERCEVWADLGECSVNNDMKRYCPKACDLCEETDSNSSSSNNKTDSKSSVAPPPPCVDQHEQCKYWSSLGECETNPNYMLLKCAKSCNSCDNTKSTEQNSRSLPEEDDVVSQTTAFGELQVVAGHQKVATMKIVEDMLQYMENSDDFKNLPKKIRKECKNRNELCAFWAAIGECEANKSFMKIQCAPACMTCHLIDIETRCPKLPDALPGLTPGSMNKMFERIVSTAPGNRTLTDEERRQLVDDDMTEYTVHVHSRPSEDPVTDVSLDTDRDLPPWVITFENFLTDEECDTLIQLGHEEGYKRSEDVGKQKFDGTVDSVKSSGRTSENAWCSKRNGCRLKDVPKRIHERMEKVMGIPADNSEDFQILRYEVGQFYRTHHDYIPHQRDRQCGPRILTFFMYLSDVEAGGGTDFPDLGITVMPKKGRALLWPSVYNADPFKSDGRMRHQALPVEAGTKFAANGWIHQFDYQTPQENGCN